MKLDCCTGLFCESVSNCFLFHFSFENLNEKVNNHLFSVRNDHGGAGGEYSGTFFDEKKKRRIRTLSKKVEALRPPVQRFQRRIMIENNKKILVLICFAMIV